MKNEELYRETFDEVHIPQALLGKVRSMDMEKKKIARRSKLKYAMTALGMMIAVFLASNGICYAATGSTWIGKMYIIIDGKKTETDVIWTKQDDGTLVAKTKIPEQDGKDELDVFITGKYDADDARQTGESTEMPDIEVVKGEDGASVTIQENGASVEGEAVAGVSANEVVLEKEEGRVYLVVKEDGQVMAKEDITEDFADGTASGQIIWNGVTYQYQVSGTVEEYDIDFGN